MIIPQLALIVPCYNEMEIITQTNAILVAYLQQLIENGTISSSSYILYVNDGSKDDTWSIIQSIASTTPLVKAIKLSRNFGHQYAVLAGLEYASEVDVAITIDADLQDDHQVIATMLEKYALGAAIVYGVRNDRSADTTFKRWTAQGFYKLLKIMGVETVYNHADYRLLSHTALEALRAFPEKHLYLRGMIPLLGFHTESVSYQRLERSAGESKYNLRKMLSLAWQGITSLSIQPLRMVTFFGFFFFGISLLLSAYAIYSYIFRDTTMGWTSTVLPIYFLGGIQLLCIGLLGEYIGKIYQEIKGRPRYIIEKIVE